MIYELQAVDKIFGRGDNGFAALRGLSLQIAPGERVAVLGPSGSGKSTLFRLLNASIFATRGKVIYHGRDVSAMGSAELRAMRRRVGSVYQQHYLVAGMSVLKNALSGALGRWGIVDTARNLVSPRGEELDRAEDCLEQVGLSEKRYCRCEQLSGGQQQRLAIARTLMQEPEVILADEPVASLDPVLADEILDLLVRLAGRHSRALLLSLHQVELARRYAVRVIGLKDGALAFDLASSELGARSLEELYRRPGDGAERCAGEQSLSDAGGPDGRQPGPKRLCIR